jgi:hypothetical protein
VVAVTPAAASIWGITGQLDPSEETQEKVQHAAQEIVDKAVARHGGQSVTVRTVNGVPADELIKASKGADLRRAFCLTFSLTHRDVVHRRCRDSEC